MVQSFCCGAVSSPNVDRHKGLGLDNGLQGQISAMEIHNVCIALHEFFTCVVVGRTKSLHGVYFHS